MIRTLWSMGKTYLTVKAVEMIAEAFAHPKSRKAAAKRPARARTKRRAAHA